MTLFIIGLVLYLGGKRLVKVAGPMPHICRGCARKYYGDACPRCDGELLGPPVVRASEFRRK
jgi:hypothetical protein